MFCIDPKAVFTAPVPLSQPGLAEPLEVQVTFLHKNRDEMKAWIKSVEGGRSELAALHEVIVSWSGMVDRLGGPVDYSQTELAKLLLAYTPAALEFYTAYLKELTEAKTKNS